MRGLVAPHPHPLGVIILLAIAVLWGWDGFPLCFSFALPPLLCFPSPSGPPNGTHYTILQLHSITLDGVSPVSNQLKDPLSPVLSLSLFPHRWFFPIIGHMGICTSTGVIRDFAGPYFVSVSPYFTPLWRVPRLK